MAIIPIRTIPDSMLKQKAKRVRTINGSIHKLIDDMLETMHCDVSRVGLAAPQIGISLRVIVIGLPEEEDIVLINPKVARRKGERLIDEGCLSVPGYSGQVKRSESVTVKGRNQNGKEIRIKAEGLLAQVLEHEIDHLDGILYVDHAQSVEELSQTEPEESGL